MAEPAGPPVEDEAPDPAQSVAIAYIHGDEGTFSFFHSLLQLLAHDLGNELRVWSGGQLAIRCGTDGLAQARNTAVRDFLADGGRDWLWFVDTDMGFPPDAIDQLMAAADPVRRPIVGALCFASRDVEMDGMGGRRTVASPTIFDWDADGEERGFSVRWNYPQNTVTRCSGTGAACILIHRSVFERMLAEFGENWYSRTRNPSTNEMISEDLSFCARAMALDIPIHVHTGVGTTHAKRVWLQEQDYWQQRAINPPPVRPATAPLVAPPARNWAVPRYALIPTYNRPARLLALVVALGAQVDHIVVLDNASSPPVDEAKLAASVPDGVFVSVLRDGEKPPNLARFWNVMFDVAAKDAAAGGHDRWDVGVFNDDAIAPAGWYGTVAGALREHPGAVCASTDLSGRLAEPALLDGMGYDRTHRLCPWAFVTRGEVGLRADESMRWWFFDNDFDLRARQAGGVLAVPGPQVLNAQAVQSTVGELAEQASRDRATFQAKWGGR